MEDALGGKGEGPVGQAGALPTALLGDRAALCRRILLVELGREMTIDVGGQTACKDIVRTAREKNVVTFVDTRRRQQPLPGDRQSCDRGGGKPGALMNANGAAENENCRHREQRIIGGVIDRQSDHRDGQCQRGQLERPSGSYRHRLTVAHAAHLSSSRDRRQSERRHTRPGAMRPRLERCPRRNTCARRPAK